MLYPFKRLKSLTHRQCTYAVIRTEPAKGQCRKKFLSRAREVASRSHEMLSRGNERTSRAHELNYFPHVPSGAPWLRQTSGARERCLWRLLQIAE